MTTSHPSILVGPSQLGPRMKRSADDWESSGMSPSLSPIAQHSGPRHHDCGTAGISPIYAVTQRSRSNGLLPPHWHDCMDALYDRASVRQCPAARAGTSHSWSGSCCITCGFIGLHKPFPPFTFPGFRLAHSDRLVNNVARLPRFVHRPLAWAMAPSQPRLMAGLVARGTHLVDKTPNLPRLPMLSSSL